MQEGWLWVGADLSESTTVDEERLTTRILTDVALATSNFVYDRQEVRRFGFGRQADLFDATLNYPTLRAVYKQTGGLVADRLKATLTFVWLALRASPKPPRGIVFAYDEAQNMAEDGCPITFTEESIRQIEKHSGGYPYFIQFICHEAFDVFVSQITTGSNNPSVPIKEITAKLDSDFFAGRWSRVTDRQRDLLYVVSRLDDPESEFSVQEIVKLSRELPVKGFSPSHASQILAALINSGIVFRNRHGKYSFAVPLLGDFIRRQYPAEQPELIDEASR